ncbi:MAG: hypothetical protein PUD16_00100 [bacterium]|nr:hypothetical protein [bacterium]
MTAYMTFAECLNHLMEKHSLTASSLAALIGVRTGLRRVLANDSTEAMRKLVFSHIIEHNLFTPQERMQLSRALEISRTGVENYRFDRTIISLMTGEIRRCETVMQTTSGVTLKKRLEVLQKARNVEILCVNSCFHSMVCAVKPLFDRPEANVSMRHLIISKDYTNATAEVVSVVFPLLFDHRYTPFSIRLTTDTSNFAVSGNLLLIRYQLENSSASHQMFFVLTDGYVAHELSNADATDLFAFYTNILRSHTMKLIPLLEDRNRYSDFSALCMTFLNHELNRATYTISNDICFQQIPSSICVDALRDKAALTPAQTEALIRRALPIHEQRYQNQYKKKKPTYRIMTLEGCRKFLNTGYSSDHFFAFRAFTPEERTRIFAEMLQKAAENPYYSPLLLRDPGFQPRYHLVCYDKLGVSFDEAITDYNIAKGDPSIFLTFPEFTKQFQNYYLQTLVNEKCYSREESLQILERMLHSFISEHQLNNE